MQFRLPVTFVLLAAVLGTSSVWGDEGMWTFDNPPSKQLKERYGFTPTQQWLDHIRLSSVRFNDGGSGSFVSPNGLILTNHHVAVGQLQKLSTAGNDLVALGFYAKTPAEELKCPDLELNILQSMENVTDRVRAAVKPGMSEMDALKARKAAIAKIEKESLDQTGLRSNIVSLYHDGEFWLYRYKKYTDVRLVMAPERQAAYFGGDLDNFTFPRYDLDMAFFRAYENDKPVPSTHYLKWNSKGAAEGELVFVSGHPGSTDRLFTYSQLEFQRDVYFPMVLKMIERRIQILREYGKQGKEQERRALNEVFGYENAKKAYSGEYQGLLDEQVMSQRKKQETDFRAKIAANAEWQKQYRGAWETINQVTAKRAGVAKQRFYRGIITRSDLTSLANTLVFYVVETRKPDADRLDGYHESDLDALRFQLFSPAPIYPDLEEAVIAGTLKMAIEELGPDDPFLKTILNGRTPSEVARQIATQTRLVDPNFRKTLAEGGETAVRKSTDPLVQLFVRLEPQLREAEEWYKQNVESVLSPATEKIAQAQFAVYGKGLYPDATFTLRLSYGAVKGYPMNGTAAPYKTTLYGLYGRSADFDRKGDFALPQRFWERQGKLDLSTPVNFVSTNDIIGGNSGSPVINRNGDIVGLIFDGNIESLVGRFVYDDTTNRAVSVHTGYISEALRKLYDAGKLADEIEAGKQASD
ncbi:MAG: S46 family peptidase [Acidobacteria bacterium]|nr:MAG: S46 family peptidase [Acidobacteriota bacterium]